ncbi:LapA family protein [Pacificimonas sp. WHA3]|uniref:LapA family protein n=1 Tax=Pacificimonas pallii TaxID=2827236 RepID=A0ABS6SGM9_9SPHN|nr:LapA family protein [Pacificimonas pallii]MBV7257562.1 LapA family protein [Pacificimonas pallii]
MRIITLVVYIVIGLFVAWFASNNFGRVPMWLPGGYEANWPLAVYLIAAMLLGALPLSLMHSISRWRWKRRVKKLEAQLTDHGTSPSYGSGPHDSGRLDPPPVTEPRSAFTSS